MRAFFRKKNLAAALFSIAFVSSVLFAAPVEAKTETIVNGALSDEAQIMLDELVASLKDGWEEEIEVEIEYEEGDFKKVEIEGPLSKAEEGLLDNLLANIEEAGEDVKLKIKVKNDPPIASDQSVSVIIGEGVLVTLEATDANNHELVYAIKSGPEHGEVSAIDGALITYTPDGTSRTDSFTFFANDGFDDGDLATVHLAVVFPGPSAVPAAGTYTSIQNIALTDASAFATSSIRYAFDGADPDCETETGTLYEFPITIFSTKTLTAVSCYEIGEAVIASDRSSFVYTIEKIELASGQISDLAANNIFVSTEASTSTPVVIQVVQEVILSVGSASGTSTVALPKDVVISRADGEDLDAALLTAAAAEASSLAGLSSGTVAHGALQWGTASATLEFSKPITLSIYVGEALNGETLDVLRSPSGSSGWTSEGIVSPTCTVADGFCTFQATKASVYAATHTPAVSSSSGGGGGGGGGTYFFDTTPPANPSVAIVKDAASGTVALLLSAEDAYEMIVSYDPEFAGAAWERYAAEKPWTFEPESGKTAVYVKFRDVSNNETEPVSAIWSEESAALEPEEGEIAESAEVAEANIEPAPTPNKPAPAEPTEAERVSYTALRYETVPAPSAPPLLAALDGVFGTSALNFSLVMLSSLFGVVFYAAYDLVRSRLF